MKHLLLLIPLAACAQHVDPCLRPIVENPLCVEMDRADHRAFLDRNHHHGVDGGDNGSGSASSDVNHDSDSDAVSDSGDSHERNDSDDSSDSNGDGSDD
jgi:hypothetical protein